VRGVQLALGVTPDGILGPQTWGAIERAAGLPLSRLEPVPDTVLARVLGGGWYEERGDDLAHDERRVLVTQVVLHESVTWTREACVTVLQRRGLSVHYIVDTDGSVTQHAPEHRACRHAGRPYNGRSVAVEYVNRYYGAHARPGQQVIQAVWAHDQRYIVPPQVQLEAGHLLTLRVLARHPIPPLSDAGIFVWGRSPEDCDNGVVAHHRWHHADGLFPEHYTTCRRLGLGPSEAYAATLASASSGQRRTILPRRQA